MSIIPYHKKTLNRISPLAELSNLHREMSRLFEGNVFAEALNGWTPALDLTQDKDQVRVVVELPGLKKEDIEISLQDGVLSISGERKEETAHKEGETRRSERFFGFFQRSIELPAEVDPNKVNASYQNGLLTVSLSKTEEAKPKQITIKVA